MARVYNTTALLLDPNNVLNAIRMGRERDEAEAQTRQRIAQGIKGLGYSAGQLAGRSIRQSEVGEVSPTSDEGWKAAVEHFVDTGDPSAMNQYKMRKEEEAMRRAQMDNEERINRERLRIQGAEAEAARKAAEAEKGNLKAKEEEQRRKDIDVEMEKLESAIIDYENRGGGYEQQKAANSYKYARNALLNLGVPENQIPELPKRGGAGEEGSAGTDTDGGTYNAKKVALIKRLKMGFDKKADLDKFVGDVEELQRTNIGSEDKDLTALIVEAKKEGTKQGKAEAKLKADVKKVAEFVAMPNRKKAEVKAQLKQGELDALLKLVDEYTSRPDWEQLQTKYAR